MASSTSFLDLTNALVHDQGAKSAFSDDPAGYLARAGFADFTPADVTTALEHAAEALPAAVAVKLTAEPTDDEAGHQESGLETVVSRLAAVAAIDAEAAEVEWAAAYPDLAGERDPDTLDFFDEADAFADHAGAGLLGDDPEGIDDVGESDDAADDLDDLSADLSDPESRAGDPGYGEGGHEQAVPVAPEEVPLEIDPVHVADGTEPGIDEFAPLTASAGSDDPIEHHDGSEVESDHEADGIDEPE